ncbi:MAG: hypothetical protein FWG79_01910 [Bacteroidales bacterium]|nr:hypothetical protein [Bacteroidales bacterium]
MNFEKVSDWFWDIAKYVITGIIITSFLGGFEEPVQLYTVSGIVVVGLILCGIFFHVLSKKNKNNKK